MSTATFSPVHGGRPSGATATSDSRHRHVVGNVLRAVKVFAAAAVSVFVLGEYGEDTGVIRR
ncbi:hypothetical protein HYE82_28675 [Streptomyces sp. BR123]|uniref:hypothetical protein n=1 Tax=Streptomyces sp. BR123 TaxID=2749828 RepID=UPI0015C49985|nr:hypothetical protein [Streptomyces sp. BR123]NXY98275.1 hypothetical protein [Streptomyces sp. BR123]